MVLADLGSRLRDALSSVHAGTPNEIQLLVKDICLALLENDVNVRLVASLRDTISKKAKSDISAEDSAANKRKKLQKIVFDALVALVDAQTAPPAPKKLRQSLANTKKGPRKKKAADLHVIMLVGLQGAGKTTSATKLAVYYKKRGFKVGLVCADTFRAGAFDQLKQNAIKAGIPYYGSYLETDPVKVAADGVVKFKADRFDIIIVDTSGRHRQEAALFGEMVQISEQVSPNQTIMVMDGLIGQAAQAQAQAFKDLAGFALIILTKMDGHAKGGGALSAVAATKTPIVFIGTGEHVSDFEAFRPQAFVSQLLGIGDLQLLLDHVQLLNLQDDENHKKTIENFKEGKFTLRDFQTQMNNFMKMGPLQNIAAMIPGLSGAMSEVGEEETSDKIKAMIYIMDLMTAQELDSDGRIFIDQPERIIRVARGAGCSAVDVEMVLQQQRMMLLMAANAKSMGAAGPGNMGASGANMARMMQGNPGLMQQAQLMMQNPGFMEQAQQMMQNPGFMQQAQQMMQNPGMMQRMMLQFGGAMGGGMGGGMGR